MSLHDQLHHAAQRMTQEERREQILDAATAVFGERGYVGATTDQIAKAAGISQAYVVRMFGTKEQLFVESALRACQRISENFRAAIAQVGPGASPHDMHRALGTGYSNLVADTGILLTLMQFTMQGSDDHLGPIARKCYLDIYRILRDEAGMGADMARDFIARGMLINTIMALRLPAFAAEDPDALEFIECIFEGKSEQIIALDGLRDRLGTARRG